MVSSSTDDISSGMKEIKVLNRVYLFVRIEYLVAHQGYRSLSSPDAQSLSHPGPPSRIRWSSSPPWLIAAVPIISVLHHRASVGFISKLLKHKRAPFPCFVGISCLADVSSSTTARRVIRLPTPLTSGLFLFLLSSFPLVNSLRVHVFL